MKLKIIKLFKLAFSIQFLIIILPFLLLSIYVVPNLEDYAESIIPEVWWHVKFLYLTYDGRYFSSFLFAALNPLKLESYFLYKLIPVSLFVLLFVALYTFLKTFLQSLPLNNRLLISSLFMLLFLHRNPNIPYSFYYMISSYIYMLPIIMFIFFLVSLQKIASSSNYLKRLSNLLAAMFLLLAILGSNELLIMPSLATILFFIFYYNLYKKKKMNEYFLLVVLYACCIFVIFTSPGIQRYFSTESIVEKDAHYVMFSFLQTLKFAHINIVNRLRFNFTLVFSLIVIAVIFFQNKSSLLETIPVLSIKKIIAVSILGVVFNYFIVFPYVYSAESKASPDYSQVFIIPYFFLLLWLCTILLLIIAKVPSTYAFSLKQKQTIVTVLCLCIYLSIIIQKNNIKTAYLELFSGEAKKYYIEVTNNIEKSKLTPLYNEPVSLCTLKHNPSTIYSGVYFKVNSERFHVAYSKYYGINKLKIVECY